MRPDRAGIDEAREPATGGAKMGSHLRKATGWLFVAMAGWHSRGGSHSGQKSSARISFGEYRCSPHTPFPYARPGNSSEAKDRPPVGVESPIRKTATKTILCSQRNTVICAGRPGGKLPTQPNKPNEQRLFSSLLLVVGIVLLIFGINAHDSVASSAKEVVTGTPTDKSIWLIVLGVIGILVGGINSLFRRSN
ncbi:MAG: DUF3185 family protein [Lacunisphaera sp.]